MRIEDKAVPVSNSDDYAAALKKAGVEVEYVRPGAWAAWVWAEGFLDGEVRGVVAEAEVLVRGGDWIRRWTRMDADNDWICVNRRASAIRSSGLVLPAAVCLGTLLMDPPD